MDIINKNSIDRRRAIIMEELNNNGQVDVNSLTEQLGVSPVTIRNDLTHLERNHLLIKARGGAFKTEQAGTDFTLLEKEKHHLSEKKRIGRAAAALIEYMDTIILDSGTTTMEIVKNMKHLSDVNVITNALNIADELSSYKNINVIIPGGLLRRNSHSLVGAAAEETFKSYFCDKLFLAVDGLSIEHGLSTPSAEEAHLNRVMISISKEVIVVTDSSKFNKRSLAYITEISTVDKIITDSGISPELVRKLEDLNIEIIII
ncbi:transcriptional repressor AgaR [Sphingobacterium pedocola]|uniref:DeoR/GlpR transcriptional regulator n=1 Tax=Sphingobacterium pedocola TaxID=2082722 RepID=A0ABR9TF13_9SPHI|nr:transcriptional repressor AgaR [Sphingobacterium pedocola]MBE8723262.1 DeoR/GlpR transcriptional regulator [Sphingobacterium pedocola]